MSLHEYETSREIYAKDYPFYSIIMAAMRHADDKNERLLRDAWPEVWEELSARYNARGGLLPDEIEAAERMAEPTEGPTVFKCGRCEGFFGRGTDDAGGDGLCKTCFLLQFSNETGGSERKG